MTRRIDFNFSHLFDGTIWNTVFIPHSDILLLEIRNSEHKKVTFSALDVRNGSFLWKDVAFDEPWWISLDAAGEGIALLTIYLETNNPDKKGIFAYDVQQQKIAWWNNDFSLIDASGNLVNGISSKYGTRQVTLDIHSGNEVPGAQSKTIPDDPVRRPHQYAADHQYFETVKTFLVSKFNLLPVTALEYLEHDSLIFVSVNVMESTLTNYLIIISGEGKALLLEKLDEHLKGIGLDTFFIYEGCVFFVRNKRELFSYKIV